MNSSNEKTREIVARHRLTPPDIFEKLADDKSWRVRYWVARNLNTPAEVLEKLSNDENKDVRCTVAENSSTPVEILEKLADDGDKYVRRGVAENSNTPVEILEEFADDEDEYVRRGVAENPSTPVEVLEKLANDKDKSVRTAISENPNAPEDIKQLAQTLDRRRKATKSRQPNADWSIPLYSIENYSQIENEIDQVVHEAANQYAKKYLGGTADVSSPEGVYDNGGQITITFHTPDGDQVAEIDAEDILGPATSQNMKAKCVKTVIKWLENNL